MYTTDTSSIHDDYDWSGEPWSSTMIWTEIRDTSTTWESRETGLPMPPGRGFVLQHAQQILIRSRLCMTKRILSQHRSGVCMDYDTIAMDFHGHGFDRSLATARRKGPNAVQLLTLLRSFSVSPQFLIVTFLDMPTHLTRPGPVAVLPRILAILHKVS